MKSKVGNNKYPVKAFSWEVFTDKIAVKHMDKSAFLHHGTAIPREIAFFFNLDRTQLDEQIETTLVCAGRKYKAHFELDAHLRIRLFWKADLSQLIQSKFPNIYSEYSRGVDVTRGAPLMEFQRLASDEYLLDIKQHMPSLNIEELKNLLDEFLKKWSYDSVKKMTLSDYVGLRDKDTFCQWVETKTRVLGSIKGLTSIKFGIYERDDKNKRPKNYKNDEKYSWLQGYGNTRNQAFERTKRDLLETIEFAERGDFKSIDSLLLPDLFKWKVAFLYSNERLIPIYKKDVLFKIATSLNLITDKNTKISEIQHLMMERKPSHLSVYEYMKQLFGKFGREKNESEETIPRTSERMTRKPAASLNTNAHVRTVTRSYLVEQKHNKLQEALKEELIKDYGEENVLLEENYVDIKLLQPNFITFFEVKSSSYASDCIRDALGQVLSYTFNDSDKREKKLVIVGQYSPNKDEEELIQYIKQKLNIDFEYRNINIKDKT
jgi:hypothetical protein